MAGARRTGAGAADPREDARAAADVVGRALSGTSGVVRDVHAAVAQRIFGAVGPTGAPARLMHGGVSRGVYAAVGAGTRAAAGVAGMVAGAAIASRDVAGDRVALRDTWLGAPVVAAVNGAWGDSLARWGNPLELGMTVRSRGRDVAVERDALRRAFPAASGDVVVFLHGLCESDASWWLSARQHWGDASSTHGSRLRELTGATPVYLRYNSGLHVSDNGARLDELLEQLVAAWPVRVDRLTLVGHSMGGLVARSACALAVDADGTKNREWVRRLRRVVYLGSPHLGAPLEVGAVAAGLALNRLPETAPLAKALAGRSVGIKDLRFGALHAADWDSLEDPDAWRAAPTEDSPLLPEVDHYFIGVTITQAPDSRVARVLGDSLVTYTSASGDDGKRSLAFEVDRGRHLGGLHHFDLLNSPRVWEVLEAWLVEGAEPEDLEADELSGPDGI
jgi:pimeloyl-ACP methyl ester carboxylesterase